MARNPHSEQPDLAPREHAVDHPQENPEDWGWHGEWGKAARIAGWVITAILLVMLTATHYNHSGSGALIIFAVGMVVVLVWDIQRRKNAWRK